MRRLVLFAPLLVAGCGVGTSATSTSVSQTTLNGVTTTRTVITTTNSGAPVQSAIGGSSTSLAAYVGHYPDDQVAGSGFWENPLVQTAVLSAVSDAAIQRVILHPNGPAVPIARMPDGRIVAETCEVHNCGSHNWSLLVADNGSNPEVCYHDDSSAPPTRWFKYDQQTRANADDCPTGEQQDAAPPAEAPPASPGGK